MKKDQLYSDLLQRGTKLKRLLLISISKRGWKWKFKTSILIPQWTKPKKPLLRIFPKRQRGARSDQLPQNKFTLAMSPTVSDESEFRMPLKNAFSYTLRVINMMGKQLAKLRGIILLLVCENLSLTMSLNFFFIFAYFTHMVRLRISLVWTEVQIQCSYARTNWSQLYIQSNL